MAAKNFLCGCSCELKFDEVFVVVAKIPSWLKRDVTGVEEQSRTARRSVQRDGKVNVRCRQWGREREGGMVRVFTVLSLVTFIRLWKAKAILRDILFSIGNAI